jgi:hypothetical protein
VLQEYDESTLLSVDQHTHLLGFKSRTTVNKLGLRHATLTWEELAQRLGVSRQAIAGKPTVQQAYQVAHKGLNATTGEQHSPEALARRTFEERIYALELELKELRPQRDKWIERWGTVEQNCRLYGYDPDKLFAAASAGATKHTERTFARPSVIRPA